MEFVLREVDRLFDENRAKDAEKFLLKSLAEAKEEEDFGVCLQILNELIGYYRQTSEKEQLLQTIDNAFQVADRMKLKGTVWYATTQLNAANGYRSIGMLEESRKSYEGAEEIYQRDLAAKDMLLAGLYNNRSLLEQEEKNFQKAEEYLLKALDIVQENQSGFEIAVTYANLANTAVLGEEFEKARDYAKKAILCFEKRKLYDAHYCSALSALGLCCFHDERYDEALSLFEEGMMIVENTLGHNTQYERLKENRDACLKKVKEMRGDQHFDKLGKADEHAAEGDAAGFDHQGKGSEKKNPNSWKELDSLLKEELGRKAEKDRKEEIKSGLELCRRYYETYGKTMLREKFPEYASRIAAGLVGEGSDCMGFDDGISRDHDWGPGFCLFLPWELEQEIGERLQAEYDALPKEFLGYRRISTPQGKDRLGVHTIEGFYKKYAGLSKDGSVDYGNVAEASLFACVDGEVFEDPEGRFTKIRKRIKEGFPEEIRFLKLAEDLAKISQTGQYNYKRMMERKDRLSADRELSDCMGHLMRFWHHYCNTYAPHDKWLKANLLRLPGGEKFLIEIEKLHGSFRQWDEEAAKTVEFILSNLCGNISKMLYDEGVISDVDDYLDHHVEELLMKASYAKLSDQKLVEKIAKVEFEAFDQVKNEGGRAYCQNDWPTFSVMRKSQYLTWNRTMLMQYLYDFQREMKIGHNLITEKYGRMMESTAPEKYEELKEHFPEIPEEKKAVIEQIVALQMGMVEELAKEYPRVVANARNLHTYEDNVIDTSYETYLRGEISTYSDKMLQLYAGYVIQCVREGINIARVTMENTAKLYGYEGLEAFQAGMGE